jgi:DNA primase
MFGANLSDVQIYLLKELDISNLVVLTDNDGAGQNAKEKIRKKCSNLFNIIDIEIPANDVGEMSIEEIGEHLKPQLKGYTND